MWSVETGKQSKSCIGGLKCATVSGVSRGNDGIGMCV